MSPQSQPDFTASQGSVPLFSGQTGNGSLLMAALWAPGIGFILALTGIDIDILSWVLLTLLAGSLVSATWSFMKRRRFRNPARNPDLLSLFEEVRRDLGKGHDIELWQRDIDRLVFLYASDIFFKAILFSDSAIADILDKREKGRVLLARAVLETEKKRPTARFLMGVLVFTAFAFLQSLVLFRLSEVLFFSFGATVIAILVLAVLGLSAAVPIMTSRKSTEINDTIERLYGTHPDAAMMDVLYGLPVSDEIIEKAKRDKEEVPGRRRKALRNATIAALVVAAVSFAAFMLSRSYSVLAVQFSLLMAAIVAGAAFFIVYLTSNMWALLTMGRGPRNTEWDIQLPLAQEVQGFLNQQEGYERLSVKGVRSPFDGKTGLVILGLKSDYDEETLHAVMPQMLEDLQDVELLGPLILADLKIGEIEGRERRIGSRVLALAIPFLIIGILWSVVVSGIYGLLSNILPILATYMTLFLVPAGYATLWKRKSVLKAEVEIAGRHPRYREALRTLIEKHHTRPYGMTSYKTRLERIDRHLGIEA